jgi:hypothetical protein
MVIDQRNAGASVTPTNLQYTVDRWQANLTAASKFNVQQNSGSVTPPAGFTKYLGITSLSAYSVTSSDLFGIMQQIEGFNVADLGWGTANAKTVTLSFQVYSSLTGTFGGSLTNGGQNYSYPFSYTIPIANTWIQISVTITGPTSGTWATDNSSGLFVRIGLGAGSTYSGTVGSWSSNLYTSATGATSVVGTNGATFYITGVQLEVGVTATSFDYRPYGTELALCQRYFYAPPNLPGFALAWVAGSLAFQGNALSHPTTMRATPTVSGVTGFTIQGVTATATGFSMTASSQYLYITGSASNGQADGALRSVNPNQIPFVSAEL